MVVRIELHRAVKMHECLFDLRRELGVEPSRQTAAVIEQLRDEPENVSTLEERLTERVGDLGPAAGNLRGCRRFIGSYKMSSVTPPTAPGSPGSR